MSFDSLGEDWVVWSDEGEKAVLAFRPDVFDGDEFPAPCLPTIYLTRGQRTGDPAVGASGGRLVRHARARTGGHPRCRRVRGPRGRGGRRGPRRGVRGGRGGVPRPLPGPTPRLLRPPRRTDRPSDLTLLAHSRGHTLYFRRPTTGHYDHGYAGRVPASPKWTRSSSTGEKPAGAKGVPTGPSV